jgi:hypothetical protein
VDAVLIQNPVFRVRLDQRCRPSSVGLRQKVQAVVVGLRQKVQTVADYAFYFLKTFWSAMRSMVSDMLQISPLLGLVSVMQFGVTTIAVIYFVSILTIACVGGASVCAVITTINMPRYRFARTATDIFQSYLQQASRIHPQHFQVVNRVVNMSTVNPSFKLQELITLLETIDVYPAESKELYQNTPGAIQEPLADGQKFTKPKLVQALQRLVDFIENKSPWLGIPPARDTQAVNRFYQKLEDLIRYSAYTTSNAYETFIAQQNGIIPSQPTEHSSEEEKALYQRYQDLLEDRNRCIVDIAVGGSACGSRAMGEALEIYERVSGTNEGDSGTLKERAVRVLADFRSRIMHENVDDYCQGFPQRERQSTHYFSACMAQLGGFLGLPGSADVTEYLYQIDPREILSRFFRKYTPKAMVEEITAKYEGKGWYGSTERRAGSEAFRDLLQDWLQQQVGDWKKDHYAQLDAKFASNLAELCQDNARIKQEAHAQVEQVRKLIGHLGQKNEEHTSPLDTIFPRQGENFCIIDEQGNLTPLQQAPSDEIVNLLINLPEARSWIIDNTGSQETKTFIANSIPHQIQELVTCVKTGVKDVQKRILTRDDQVDQLISVITMLKGQYKRYGPYVGDNGYEMPFYNNNGEEVDLSTLRLSEFLPVVIEIPQVINWIKGRMGGCSDPIDKWQSQFIGPDGVDANDDAFQELMRGVMTADVALIQDVKKQFQLQPIYSDPTKNVYRPLNTMQLEELLTLLENTTTSRDQALAWRQKWMNPGSHGQGVPVEQTCIRQMIVNMMQGKKVDERAIIQMLRGLKTQEVIRRWIDNVPSARLVDFIDATMKNQGDAALTSGLESAVAAAIKSKEINVRLREAQVPTLDAEGLGMLAQKFLEDDPLRATYGAMKAYLQRMREKEFLGAILGSTDLDQGTPPTAVIEWFLIAHGILQY